MTEVAHLPSTASPHLQVSDASCASEFRTPTPDTPRTVKFYCADVPDLSEFFYSKSMSDVNIVVGERKIAAHRSRLASVSPFLASIFASDTSDMSTVLLPDMNFAAVNVLINFLYSGFMRVTKKEIAGILEVATLLGISYPIDIEETALGVVRIKPQSAKKRSFGQDFGSGLMAKKARISGPKVVIFEGLAKTHLDKLLENLETPVASPRREAETVNLMEVDEVANLPSSLESAHSFEIVNVNGNSRTVSPTTTAQIMDIASNPVNIEQQNQTERFESTLVSADSGEEQENNGHQTNQNDSDCVLQPVVLCVQGNIDMLDETDGTVILNEEAPSDSHVLPSDDEDNLGYVPATVDLIDDEAEHQVELNEDDRTSKDQDIEDFEQVNESVEQQSDPIEQESESAEQDAESAEEGAQTNDDEELAVQEVDKADGLENEDVSEQQDQTEEVCSSHAKEPEKNAENLESHADLNETAFFSPNSQAEAIETTDDTDSFKSTENENNTEGLMNQSSSIASMDDDSST